MAEKKEEDEEEEKMNKSGGSLMRGQDHKCFNIFLDKSFEYKNRVEDYYSHVAEEYDNFMSKTLYNGPKIVAEHVEQYVKDKSSWLLDVCGGTGMSGLEVSKHGFINIDYIDGSEGMVKEARKKGVYKELYREMLFPQQPTSLQSGKYDCVYSVGSYVPGHLKPEIAQEYIRIMKPGAYCVIGMREQWLETEDYKDKLEPYMNSMTTWTLVARKVVTNWYNEYDGVMLVYRKNFENSSSA